MEAERGIVDYIAIEYFIMVSIKINLFFFVLEKKTTKIGPILPEKRAGKGKTRSDINIHKKRQATQREFCQS